MVTFTLQQQRGVVVTQTTWSTMPKLFIFGPFKERVYGPLFQGNKFKSWFCSLVKENIGYSTYKNRVPRGHRPNF